MLEIVKTKELKSTTRVEGILVQMSNGEWYGVSRAMPPRNPWFIRGSKATRTGRLSMENIFLKQCREKPTLEEGIELLVNVLNGGDAPQDKIFY